MLNRANRYAVAVLASCALGAAFLSCVSIRAPVDGTTGGTTGDGRRVDAGTPGSAPGVSGGGGAGAGAPPAGSAPPVADGGGDRATCGNGRLDPTEVCDDGNVRDGDGCRHDCGAIEPDFSCPVAGQPCVYLVKCGDGQLGGNEGCDPPDVGHGCSATCQLEPGWVCDGPASCRRTVCGDGHKEGTEACDDGNQIDGDGCSASCTLEPDCGSGVCVSKCGDGLKLPPEACDDGNQVDGDGCAHDCTIEVGFSCADTTASPPDHLALRVVYRDFISFPTGGSTRHPDFEIFSGMDVTPLLVEPVLGADGKPIIDGRCTQPGVTALCPYDQQLTTAGNFAEWYRDTPGINITIPSVLMLPRLPGGAYVYDSAPAGFYPIDNQGFTAPPARELPALADAVVNDGGLHNFGFTTEIHTFLQYRGGESLVFSGDDDMWIFLNRHLALDVGGLHTRTERTLAIDDNAAAWGLAVGGLYPLELFHAERHSAGSNFKLTLTGFSATSSRCTSTCGDGVVAKPVEQCDDGNTVDGDGCSHDCRHETVIP
jgi:fibro-slime domain-containing protein